MYCNASPNCAATLNGYRTWRSTNFGVDVNFLSIKLLCSFRSQLSPSASFSPYTISTSTALVNFLCHFLFASTFSSSNFNFEQNFATKKENKNLKLENLLRFWFWINSNWTHAYHTPQHLYIVNRQFCRRLKVDSIPFYLIYSDKRK